MSSSKKPHLNLAILGHVDHGKSTLVGHLMFLTGAIDEKTMREIEEMAKKMGKESFKFAWILDKYKEERERGLTIDVSHVKFETGKYFFTIIDCPGHRDFVKNMIIGTSQADAALLVVSAHRGEFEAGIGPQGQTREHIFLARTLGIGQVVVVINKMDLVNYDYKRYLEVAEGVAKLLKLLGYKITPVEWEHEGTKYKGYAVNDIPFIPVSALYGDNLIQRSPKMPWYKGPTVIEALDMLREPPRPIDKPLRIPIQDVFTITGVGTVPVGRVESGVLKVGDKVVFMPPNKVGEVRSIETHHVRIDEAKPGDNIGFNVRGVSKDDLRRGDVAGHPTHPPTVAEEFVARIFILWHPTAIGVGYTPVLHIHTATVPAKIVELIAKLDPRTGAVVEQKPAFLKQGDAAVVRIKPLKPVVVEKYSDFPGLGRFALRDMGRTVAAGQVIEVKPAKVT